MNTVKNTFSIKDLENLTGIKAHTIRIWEKRYNLLQPERTDTNIRYYDLESLQMLLNVSYLNENGYKISKIAALPKGKTSQLVKKIATDSVSHIHVMNLFKLAMINFDQQLFQTAYKNVSKGKSFRELFYEVFVPLLTEIGVLWQTDTITPAHEHFVSNLIRQKIILNTEKFQQKKQTTSDSTFVLFLPDNEIHELGLLYLNLEIISRGHHSILLGPSVPISSLVDILDYYDDITFISYFTIKPEKKDVKNYLNEFKETILKKKTTKFWMLGKMTQHINTEKLPNQMKVFYSIENLVEEL
ncbi:MAG: MerR family transcriptional regulator [Aquaticitalea sp.]